MDKWGWIKCGLYVDRAVHLIYGVCIAYYLSLQMYGKSSTRSVVGMGVVYIKKPYMLNYVL